MQIKKDTRIILNYDTTSSSRVDGKWPSLIFNFMCKNKDKYKMYPLRALFFAYENRDQILQLVIETLQRLATATSGNETTKEL